MDKRKDYDAKDAWLVVDGKKSYELEHFFNISYKQIPERDY